MCGIVGFLGFQINKDLKKVTQFMLKSLVHRGPDSQDIWIDESHRVSLGHARLSILDLSKAGNQPMTSICQRYVIVFNGEVYNHLKIRAELESSHGTLPWKGHSDTETLVNALSFWGIEKTLKKSRGMFAAAIWDCSEKKIFLVRDRMGEKPLYYGWVKGNFIFSSELKSIRQFPGFEPQISQEALNGFLNYSAVPAPISIYKDIFKLKPGCILEINLNGQEDIYPYWQFEDVVHSGISAPYQDEHIAIQDLKNILFESVKMQMISDVPLGGFLSGGVDSSIIVALMQEISIGQTKTFTIGFEDEHYDESIYAKKVAQILGTEHHCVMMNSKNLLDVIPLLPKIYDEPFADSSQIPTFLVSKIAKQHVKVALSGDAGDELFGGYQRYIMAPNLWNKIEFLPFSLRKVLASVCFYQSHNLAKVLSWMQMSGGRDLIEQRVLKFSRNLKEVQSIDEFYHTFLVNGLDKNLNQAQKFISEFSSTRIRELSPQERMMYYDSLHYLPNDILTKVDRAAMSVSLETRVPMLDPSVIEIAWRIPQHMKFRNRRGKWILRQILSEYLPQELIDRPKMGFGIPLGNWLRTSLRDWAEELLSPQSLNHGLLDAENIHKLWKEHIEGRVLHGSYLWNICMFQAWYKEYM